MNSKFIKLCILSVVVFLMGCNPFMYGYTHEKALNNYCLVTGNKNSFGDKRIKYNKGYRRGSALSNFLNCSCNDRGLPDFIYEYTSATKCDGMKLYYMRLDSVFIFEEPKKHMINSRQIAARKMDSYERETYVLLKMAHPN